MRAHFGGLEHYSQNWVKPLSKRTVSKVLQKQFKSLRENEMDFIIIRLHHHWLQTSRYLPSLRRIESSTSDRCRYDNLLLVLMTIYANISEYSDRKMKSSMHSSYLLIFIDATLSASTRDNKQMDRNINFRWLFADVSEYQLEFTKEPLSLMKSVVLVTNMLTNVTS